MKQDNLTYHMIDHRTWAQILSEDICKWTPPQTVHLPIQAVHSPDFIHVDCSLNVCRRRIIPGLSVSDTGHQDKAGQLEVMLVEMLPADPPFVPQGRSSRMSLAEGKYPVATVEYFADLLYRFEYFCVPGDRPDRDCLWVTCRVTNTSSRPRSATVRARIGFAPEKDLFEHHYIPFFWDNTKYRHPTQCGLNDERILRNGKTVGRVLPGSFTCNWEQKAAFTAEDYAVLNMDYFVEPAHRFTELTECLRFHRDLASGEEAAFSFVLLTNYEQSDEGDLQMLASADSQTDRSRSLAHFKSLFPVSATRMICPAGCWDRIFEELQISSLQLMVPFPDFPGLAPTQGGAGHERHLIWVQEAVLMLLPLLKLGRFKEVRAGLDFIFSMQDGGFPPEGRFTTLEGAVGTTGPRWINSTGSALALAADYYSLSKDEAFLRDYLPRILRAADWIVGELRATRQVKPDGSRSPMYGLMPCGRATDGDVGHVIAYTDAYTFWGLDKTVRLLKILGHPRHLEFERERDHYRADITTCAESLARADGFIDRKIVTGDPEEKYAKVFEVVCSIAHLAFTGGIDLHNSLFDRYVAYAEAQLMDGPFTGKMNHEIYYMGCLDLVWQQIYLKRGAWKKAFLAARVNLKYGMTQDTFQVQERFSISNPAFTPFQPNGSGNGRVLEMMLSSFYFENADDDVTLLAGIPFLWLQMNGRTALTQLHTSKGQLSIEANMEGDHCRLWFRAEDDGALPTCVRIPEHFEVIDAAGACRDPGVQRFRTESGCREVKFLLRDNDFTSEKASK